MTIHKIRITYKNIGDELLSIYIDNKKAPILLDKNKLNRLEYILNKFNNKLGNNIYPREYICLSITGAIKIAGLNNDNI